MKNAYDVIIIGGGPGGLAAAIEAKKAGADVLLIEREARLGGILKQCIHDGFGLVRFKEKLSGPEYVGRFIDEFHALQIDSSLLTFVTKIDRHGDGSFTLSCVTQKGIEKVTSRSIVLATGCRERTAKQVAIHGTRPAGVFTAGTAQHFVNILGLMPTKRCVILGSGDIGLIMARRLTLEGAEVVGVYEAKPTPSGLTRNIVQCLEDFNIPLHLSTTVTRVFGQERLEAVEISRVDETMKPISGTEEIIACDALILSVGLIPENEVAQSLGSLMDPHTKGPVADSRFMTSVPGVFVCGNALHVNDLVDYVSESGELAGRAAAMHAKNRDSDSGQEITIAADRTLQYLVPQKICREDAGGLMTVYFRTAKERASATLVIRNGDTVVYSRSFTDLRPPEMQRIVLPLMKMNLRDAVELKASLEEGS